MNHKNAIHSHMQFPFYMQQYLTEKEYLFRVNGLETI